MPPSTTNAAFSALKLAQLRLLLSHIGSASSGTKPVLLAKLEHALQYPVIPSSFPPVIHSTKTIKATRHVTRVLSIDMGIRNLAYCVADVSMDRRKDSAFSLDIVEWKRVNVLPKQLTSNETSPQAAAASDVEPFSPAQLAPTAVSLVKRTFMPRNPRLIAIERQRFRSAGGSAVLEWTLRVNMLESMLWSAFQSVLEPSTSSTAALIGVSPSRVARFWVPKVAGGKAAIEKKQKVEVVRKWFGGSEPSGLSITASKEAEATRDMVMTGRVQGVDKVDDLADCLLQAGALAIWERNRQLISRMCQEELLQYCNDIAEETSQGGT